MRRRERWEVKVKLMLSEDDKVMGRRLMIIEVNEVKCSIRNIGEF